MGVVLCLAMTAGAYLAGVHPLVQAHAESVMGKKNLDDMQGLVLEREQLLAQALRQQAEMGEALKTMPQGLQSIGQLNQRLAELTALALNHELRVRTVATGQTTETPEYLVVPIRLTGNGGFQAYTSFMHSLHLAYPDVFVQAFDLTGDPSKPKSPASFALDLTWHAARKGGFP